MLQTVFTTEESDMLLSVLYLNSHSSTEMKDDPNFVTESKLFRSRHVTGFQVVICYYM